MKYIGAGKYADAGAVAGSQGKRMRAPVRGRCCQLWPGLDSASRQGEPG
ncbi:MAG: hypothetical protein PHY05_11475 [Methanothrix sp.]|nr:hypothetical protein [Methanothrix sp.]